MSRRSLPVLIPLLLVLLFLWWVRPIFHGLVMFFYTGPIIWLPPIAILVIGFGIRNYRRRRPEVLSEHDLDRLRGKRDSDPIESVRARLPSVDVRVIAGLAFVAFLFGGALKAPLTNRAIYTHTDYSSIGGLPAGGVVRLMPQEVAVQIASSGFNSPTEKLTDFRSVSTPTGLAWTSFRTPDGAFRIFSKKSQGIVTLNAESTERRVKATDSELEIAPGQLLTDNLRWRLLKRHYLIELANPVGALDNAGEPIIIVPYISYKGWLIRRPVLGGVFVVHPDGDIEDLSPDEARARPEVASSGRLFPDTLARRIQDAYAYKRGIWNRFVLHEEQTQISDTENNQQPYLIDFGEGGAKWVTVAEPYGHAFAANAIFLTDTVTGKTEIWRVPRNASLSGNRRAVQTVRSVSIPGVVFASENASNGTGGRFKVVEPRPVFVRGRLLYLLSIIPENANSVSKSVVVDAERNKVVAIFDNDTDPSADEKTLRYLATGTLDQSALPQQQSGAKNGAAPSATGPTGPEQLPSKTRNRAPASVQKRLERLIQQQRDTLRETEQLRRELERGR
jgi:hypothetical protein